MVLAGTPEFLFFTLILMRMSGFVFLNPIFGRKNIPGMFKAGLAFMLAICVYSASAASAMAEVEITSAFVYGFLLLKEFAMGFLVGFTMQLFEMVVTYAGAVIDFQMGLSMSTVYDVQNGSQIALTGSILQIYYMLLFFAVDGHLAIMKIIMTSGEVVPYAAVGLGTEAIQAIVSIFVECIVLAVKLALPIIAFEFLMEVGTGLLMRIIPQINLFVMSIQLRVIIGIFMLVFLVHPIGNSIEGVISSMTEAVQAVLKAANG